MSGLLRWCSRSSGVAARVASSTQHRSPQLAQTAERKSTQSCKRRLCLALMSAVSVCTLMPGSRAFATVPPTDPTTTTTAPSSPPTSEESYGLSVCETPLESVPSDLAIDCVSQHDTEASRYTLTLGLWLLVALTTASLFYRVLTGRK